MIIRYSRYANARLHALPESQQAQAKRLIQAIILANTTIGRPWNRDLQGRLQWIVSAVDTHVVYRIAFRIADHTLYVTNVLALPTPEDPNNV
jgi:hypothetical protein